MNDTVVPLHPLVAALARREGARLVTTAEADAFCATPGTHLLVFTEDPARYKETLDLAVIVPELARAFPGRFTIGVLDPPSARALQPRFGFRRWPALALVRDGVFQGAIDGLRNWDDYIAELTVLLDAAAPAARPAIPIVAASAGATTTESFR